MNPPVDTLVVLNELRMEFVKLFKKFEDDAFWASIAPTFEPENWE